MCVCVSGREIADFGSLSGCFQSPSIHLATKGPNMEPHNVCFSIIKKCLAAPWERLLATVVWLWKTNRTETRVRGPLQPAAQKSSLIIMILQRSDCILLLNGLAQIYPPKNNPPVPERGIKTLFRVTHRSFYGLCLAFLCCDSKLSLRQLLHYASVYLRHHSSVLFSILNLPSQFSHLFCSEAPGSVAVYCPPVSATVCCTSYSWDKNKRLSSNVPVLESGPWIR